MTTIKSYTDLNQSKKLAEILPIKSADMGWNVFVDNSSRCLPIDDWALSKNGEDHVEFIPCWSLSALLNVLPDGTNVVKEEADTENEKYMCTVGIKNDIISTFANNPIDACYEMIIKLNGLKKL